MTAKLLPGLIKTRRKGVVPRIWQRIYPRASPEERHVRVQQYYDEYRKTRWILANWIVWAPSQGLVRWQEGRRLEEHSRCPHLPRRGLVIKERNVGMCVARCILDVNGVVCLSRSGRDTDRMRWITQSLHSWMTVRVSEDVPYEIEGHSEWEVHRKVWKATEKYGLDRLVQWSSEGPVKHS